MHLDEGWPETMQATFSLTFMGVGGGLSPELGNNNCLLESTDRKHNLLIDCGPLTAASLKMADQLSAVQAAFITHVHDDHVGGLELWAQLNRYVYRQRPKLIFPDTLFEELWDHGLRGGLERVNAPAGQGDRVVLDAYFDVHRLLDDGHLELEGLPVLTPIPTLHVLGKPSYSFFLGEDIYYSSDTQYLPPALGPTGKPLRAIFQDCQLFDAPHMVHTSLAQLARDMTPELKRITRLMHYNHAPDVDAAALGFIGFVERGQPIWL